MKKLFLLELCLVASVAACGGGGHSDPPAASGGPPPVANNNPPPVNTIGPTGDPTIQNATVFNASSAGQMFSDTVNTTPSATGPDTTSTVTIGTDAGGNQLVNLNINSGGATYNHTFNLTQNSQELTDGWTGFNGVSEGVAPDGGVAHTLIYDPTLTYTTYGIWTTDTGATSGGSGGFAAGQDTPVANIPTTGTANYTGQAIGVLNNGQPNGVYNLTGTSNVTANFGTQTVNGSLALNGFSESSPSAQSWNTLTFNANMVSNTNKFAGSISAPASTGAIASDAVSGNVAGAFYGPAVNEVGGAFSAAGGATSVYGAFGAAKH